MVSSAISTATSPWRNVVLDHFWLAEYAAVRARESGVSAGACGRVEGDGLVCEVGEVDDAGGAAPGCHGAYDAGEVVGGASGAYVAEDGDGALAVGEGLVEVAVLEVRGGQNGHAQADGAGVGAFGHGCGPVVPAQGGVGQAQVPVDFHGVGCHPCGGVVADPCGFVAGFGVGLLQEPLGGDERGGGGGGV